MVTPGLSTAFSRMVKEAQLRAVRDDIARELRRRADADLTPYPRYVELVMLEAHLMDELDLLDASAPP